MPDQQTTSLIRRHLAFGWWSLLFFLLLGIGLEAMHGFKVAWYLNVGMETRRLMWRLAHAHGAFLSLVNIAFAATLYVLPGQDSQPQATQQVAKRKKRKNGKESQDTSSVAWSQWASRCLMGASFGLPGGFFLGGVVVRGGDPGLGVLVLPIGAVLLLAAVLLVARGTTRRGA